MGGTISSVTDAVEYLTWTFYFRRLILNPSYYGLEDPSEEGVKQHLLQMVRSRLTDLADAACIGFQTPVAYIYVYLYIYIYMCVCVCERVVSFSLLVSCSLPC